ncbi:hypothetical protein PINS_up015216 [Pythium insidiosum]|nr:hypothetical protein PINS_up015216 [Pythium insidiosum]
MTSTTTDAAEHQRGGETASAASSPRSSPPSSPASSSSPSPPSSPSRSASAGSTPKENKSKGDTNTNANTNGSSGTPKCRFNDCDNPATDDTDKCAFHKNRRQCCVPNCTNQVYARKLCVRHGGKKQCQADGCEAHARGGGYCLQHGGFVVKRFCIVEGCSKQAHARQKCVRHGGGRRCKVDGCMQHARAGGLCNRHSHGHQCRIEGCKKTAQHSGSICFRHAMELRAHGEQVPELNISKGGRLSSKKRQQLQREQQQKQEQFHHQQLQQQQMQIQQQQQQPSGDLGSNNAAQSSQPGPGPFGLPLKINVPTNIPKLSSLKTPLGGFPTPRSHDFSLLLGLPSPQIDHSQLPSVLAMANQQRGSFDTSSVFTPQGPPSLSRGQRTPGQSFLSLGVFSDADVGEVNAWRCGRRPRRHHQQLQQVCGCWKRVAYCVPSSNAPVRSPPVLDNLLFDQAGHLVHHPAALPTHTTMTAAMHSRGHHLAVHPAAPLHVGAPQLHRAKVDFVPAPHAVAAPVQPAPPGFEGYTVVDPPTDYAAQFFADNGAEKAARQPKLPAAAVKATGVAAA